MLVSLAAALFTLIAFDIHGSVVGGDSAAVSDPLRLIEAVTAGVAFLAAGNIIRRGGGVEGLTTGAGLWLAGAVGLACGHGLYGVAGLATGLALLVITLLRQIERLFPSSPDKPREDADSGA